MTETAQRLRRLDPAREDLLVAGALLVLAQAECWLAPSVAGQRPETALAAAVMATALAWRRRRPFGTLVVVMVALTALALVAGLPNVVFLLPIGILAVYSLAAHASPDRAVVGLALALAALPIGAIRTDDPAVTDLTAPAVLFTATWFGARSLRARRLRTTELEARTDDLKREREEAERVAADAERRRIARELHDIVAHRVTTIIIQSESGLATADEPERARAAFSAIGDSGREALTELRRLLGLLREEDAGAGTRPQPGLGQLDSLLADARTAGLQLDARVEGRMADLPPGVDLAAYRILQEGLTNALRHGGTPTSLVIRRDAHALGVEIRNPLSDSPPYGSGAGHGLAGMRERVRVYGGGLAAGAANGEFVVRATLPFGEATG